MKTVFGVRVTLSLLVHKKDLYVSQIKKFSSIKLECSQSTHSNRSKIVFIFDSVFPTLMTFNTLFLTF